MSPHISLLAVGPLPWCQAVPVTEDLPCRRHPFFERPDPKGSRRATLALAAADRAAMTAVNEELRRSGHGQHQLEKGDLPASGRGAFLEAWAAERGIGVPNKVRVAARFVELRGQQRLVSGSRRTALQGLYKRLRRALRIDEALHAGARLSRATRSAGGAGASAGAKDSIKPRARGQVLWRHRRRRT